MSTEYSDPDASDKYSRIEQAAEDAIAFAEAGNYAEALKRARTASWLIATIPDTEVNEERVRWDRAALKQMVDDLERLTREAPIDDAGHGALVRPIEISFRG
jgi:hypothetical protein